MFPGGVFHNHLDAPASSIPRTPSWDEIGWVGAVGWQGRDSRRGTCDNFPKFRFALSKMGLFCPWVSECLRSKKAFTSLGVFARHFFIELDAEAGLVSHRNVTVLNEGLAIASR